MTAAPKTNKSSSKPATKGRTGRKSTPEKTYVIKRKIPFPQTLPINLSSAKASKLREQLALFFTEAPNSVRVEPKPFLKWAGGKSSTLRQLEEYFPREITRFFEPFLGGGAVFFHLKHRFPLMKAFLRDSNKELINCYRIVRDRPVDLMLMLDYHAKAFKTKGATYFYEIRKQHDLADDLARAARTIFLNKTCFNGLWRVNARGEFNTPVGSNANPSLYDYENIRACSYALRDAQLEAEDFRQVTSMARRGDFIYFDPPYLPISAYSDFKRYTADQFREADQVELSQVFRELDAKGCYVVLSNSDHPRTREIYSGFPISIVSAPRFINCKPGGRGNVSELVITNACSKNLSLSKGSSTATHEFPETKYMGSKQRLLPFILKHISSLKFRSFLDAFSGSGCVG
ncbi:MAG TPA: hypothetical protein DCM68_01110, partial [Verrucomicrobia bacterium]|nr:hypothetical protein [Verrucomicrobiota bacterium]